MDVDVGKMLAAVRNVKVSRYFKFGTSMLPISLRQIFVKVPHVGKLLLDTLLLYESCYVFKKPRKPKTY